MCGFVEPTALEEDFLLSEPAARAPAARLLILAGLVPPWRDAKPNRLRAVPRKENLPYGSPYLVEPLQLCDR